MDLVEIQTEINLRVSAITTAHPHWPCRKGCDDCCRSLVAVPHVSKAEWDLIANALDHLPPESAAHYRQRIRESATATRPVTCPLLDTHTGSCSIYAARPVACRTYGFYAERQYVLGCHRIEDLSTHTHDIIWGNHVTLAARLAELGDSAPLSVWLARTQLLPGKRSS